LPACNRCGGKDGGAGIAVIFLDNSNKNGYNCKRYSMQAVPREGNWAGGLFRASGRFFYGCYAGLFVIDFVAAPEA
jgi:hypothetical protein